MPGKKKVQLWKAANGRWYFHVRNPNGRNTSPSQGYAHERSAVARIRREHPGLPIEKLTRVLVDGD